MQENRVQPLGWEDLLEKKKVNHSSILAWEIPWTEEPDGLQSMGSQRDELDLANQQQSYLLYHSTSQTLARLRAACRAC